MGGVLDCRLQRGRIADMEPEAKPDPKIFPFEPIRFEPQPEHLVRKAREQVKAVRKQYLESLSKPTKPEDHPDSTPP
jgi:hypothetical protein